MLAPSAICRADEPTRISIVDHTGRGFAPDRVRYRVDGNLRADGLKNLRLLDAQGQAVPIQFTDEDGGKGGKPTLTFVTALPANGRVDFTLSNNPSAPQPTTAVSKKETSEGVEIANGLFAVRLPKLESKKFTPTVEAGTLPPPILAFRGANESAWRGGGKLASPRKVKSFTSQILDEGPVVIRACVRYEFENGGEYSVIVEVADQAPMALVREQYDMREIDGRDYWELDLTAGWAPDMAEIASTNGNGQVDPGKNIALTDLGPTPSPITAKWMIVGGNAWVVRSQLGLFNAAEKKASPDRYAMAGLVPLHHGDWRRATGIEIQTKDCKQVQLRLPVSVRPTRWDTDISSENSPMAVIEHDGTLPPTMGRRCWGLVLARPQPLLKNKAPVVAGPFYETRLWYGVVGLDHYKDFVLDWPDTKPAYPRAFMRPQEAAKFRESADQSPIAETLKKMYVVSGDAKAATQAAAGAARGLADAINYAFLTPTHGHHHSYSPLLSNADNALACAELPAEQRAELRTKLALLTYLHVDNDVMCHGTGNHVGNPNMSIARQMEMCNLIAMLPDHPSFDAWRNHALAYALYKFAINTAPGGGWFEFGDAYHMHAFNKINRATLGLVTAFGDQAAPGKSKAFDEMFNYVSPDWRYYMNLLTPVDPRWGCRMIPGGANSAPGMTAWFYEGAGVLAERDPALASNLQWAWLNNGANANFNPMAGRPWVKPVEPRLGSVHVPGIGVIFRAHQGPDETWMFLRSGYLWSHWYVDDQNSFTLFSKGALLLPYQPFQYYSRESGKPAAPDFNLYNTLRIGDASNETAFGWPDTNVLDYRFTPGVDYAWCSTGLPAWYFDSRKLAPGVKAPGTGVVWNRQVVFLKGKTGKSPNYFVIRDSLADTPGGSGAAALPTWLNLNLLGKAAGVKADGNKLVIDTEFPTKLDVHFAQGESVKPEFMEDRQTFVPPFAPPARDEKNLSPNWLQADGSVTPVGKRPVAEQHVMARVAGNPGQDRMWVVYPRGEGEKEPTVTRVGETVIKIETQEGVDYVFLSASNASATVEGKALQGMAAVVRVRDGKAETIVLSAAKPPSKEPIAKSATGDERVYTIQNASGAAMEEVTATAEQATIRVQGQSVRFTAGEGYACLTAGELAIRGMGPFDVTLTPTQITGTVDGVMRTLVMSRPMGADGKGLRPAFYLDDVRYNAGFPDEADQLHPTNGRPRFDLALGVTAGKHTLRVVDWTYPAVPQPPAHKSLSISGK